ncbi:hypothetical protein MMC29_006927 [Sticta canariensis]|nr:hypothetical protein [Sticta canariensis]
MHFSTLIAVFLVTLISFVAADNAAIFPAGPAFLAPGSFGAAFQLSSGDSRAYYLSGDGAIHELYGNGEPDRNIKYTDVIRVPASKLREGTPFAVVASNSGSVRIFL